MVGDICTAMGRRLGTAWLCGALVFFCPSAWAALDTDSATRQVNRRFYKEAEQLFRPAPSTIIVPKVPEEASPASADEPLFFVKKITVKGIESLPVEMFAPMIAKYEDRKVSLGELHKLASTIQTKYLEEGLIAACIIPPQDIQHGEVELRVVETRMGELIVKDERGARKKVLERYWRTHKGEILRYAKIERSLQMMNRNPDRRVKADLRAGKEPGTTDILLDVVSRRPWHITMSSDMEGSAASGRLRNTMGFRHNNFLGWDDTLLLGYTLSHHSDGRYVYHRVPLNGFGTSLMYGYSVSRNHPQREFAMLELYSSSKSSSVTVYQDLFQDDKGSGELSLGFEAKDSSTTMFTGTTTRDRLRIVRAGGNFNVRAVGGSLMLAPSLSQGLTGLGAAARSELSSRSAREVFTKFNMDAAYQRPLAARVSLVERMAVQLVSGRMPSAEAFCLGGMNSVRGYPDGDRIADNAIRSGTELYFPLPFIPEGMKLPFSRTHALKDCLAGLIFFDKAFGVQHVEKGTDNRVSSMQSVGVGLRLQVDDKLQARLEWGVPLGNEPLSGHRQGRVHFSFDYQY